MLPLARTAALLTYSTATQAAWEFYIAKYQVVEIKSVHRKESISLNSSIWRTSAFVRLSQLICFKLKNSVCRVICRKESVEFKQSYFNWLSIILLNLLKTKIQREEGIGIWIHYYSSWFRVRKIMKCESFPHDKKKFSHLVLLMACTNSLKVWSKGLDNFPLVTS